jgi:ubiquinone biosynthesis protein COQ9
MLSEAGYLRMSYAYETPAAGFAQHLAVEAARCSEILRFARSRLDELYYVPGGALRSE